MTSLFLLRHAKAAPALPGMGDFDRPLDAAGVSEARRVGAAMAARNLLPLTVLCSASLRTRQTLDEIEAFLPAEIPERIFSRALYSADASGYLDEIRAAPSARALLVIGHNPSTEELGGLLVSRRDRQAADLMLQGFATGALAHFEFDGALADLKPHSCGLAAFLRPKDL
jgi:phosphohistidine phosphatase